MAMAALTSSSSAITLLNKPFLPNRSSFFSSDSQSHLLRFSASTSVRPRFPSAAISAVAPKSVRSAFLFILLI